MQQHCVRLSLFSLIVDLSHLFCKFYLDEGNKTVNKICFRGLLQLYISYLQTTHKTLIHCINHLCFHEHNFVDSKIKHKIRAMGLYCRSCSLPWVQCRYWRTMDSAVCHWIYAHVPTILHHIHFATAPPTANNSVFQVELNKVPFPSVSVEHDRRLGAGLPLHRPAVPTAVSGPRILLPGCLQVR